MIKNSQPIILASGSPRRKDLLENAGYQFAIVPPEVEEIDDPSIEIRKLTSMNARLKATAVAQDHPDRIIVAADTLVLFDNESLGKPADMVEAGKMIRRLNGKTHHVYTAVCILKQASNDLVEFDVSTEVTFKSLEDEEMDRYHALIDPLDKAGAYAAQEHGHLIIEKSVGSSTNVIGLPMDELAEKLELYFSITPKI